MFYNYKQFHSTVLMAICDANYRFLLVDIGSYGRDNDAAIFSQTEFGIGFKSGQFNIPDPSLTDGFMLPYVLVGDDIFPLTNWLMKPFPGKSQSEEQAIFNYRLSRYRWSIENAFGILSARWRIFRRPIRANPDTVDLIVQAAVVLHNYLQLTNNAHYIPQGFVDSEDSSGNLIGEEWRSIVGHDANGLRPLRRSGSNNYSFTAKSVRENFLSYFNSNQGLLPWQKEYVRRCGKTRSTSLSLS